MAGGLQGRAKQRAVVRSQGPPLELSPGGPTANLVHRAPLILILRGDWAVACATPAAVAFAKHMLHFPPCAQARRPPASTAPKSLDPNSHHKCPSPPSAGVVAKQGLSEGISSAKLALLAAQRNSRDHRVLSIDLGGAMSGLHAQPSPAAALGTTCAVRRSPFQAPPCSKQRKQRCHSHSELPAGQPSRALAGRRQQRRTRLAAPARAAAAPELAGPASEAPAVTAPAPAPAPDMPATDPLPAAVPWQEAGQGLTLFAEGSAAFRVWAPHAAAIALQIVPAAQFIPAALPPAAAAEGSDSEAGEGGAPLAPAEVEQPAMTELALSRHGDDWGADLVSWRGPLAVHSTNLGEKDRQMGDCRAGRRDTEPIAAGCLSWDEGGPAARTPSWPASTCRPTPLPLSLLPHLSLKEGLPLALRQAAPPPSAAHLRP